MKNRILSLLLMAALLLSIVPAVGATETQTEPTWSCSLTLQESIAINFKVAEADLADFEQIAFYKGDTLVKTVTEKPVATNGKVSFSFADLTPSELGTKITAKLTVGGKVYEKSLSVLDYCEAILSGYYHTSLKKIATDLLNYGAASQTYVGVETATLVNADLSAYEQALGTQGDPSLENILAQGEAIDGATATWKSVGLNLQDSVTIRFKFAAESTDGLTLKVTCDGKSWEITRFASAGEGLYYAYFSELNPAQMRDTVTAVVCNAEGAPVSRELTYSIASYAAYVVNEDTTGQYANELELVKAMVRYGDAVSAWLEAGGVAVPADSVLANGKYIITAVDTNGNELATLGNSSGSSNIAIDPTATWNIRVLDETGAAYLTTLNSDGEVVYPVRADGGSNMAVGKTETIWTIATSGDYYTFSNKNSDNRYLACTGSKNADSGIFTPTGFKAYTSASEVRFTQFKLTPVVEEPILESGKYHIVAKVGDSYFAMIDEMHDSVTVKAQAVTLDADNKLTAPCVDAWTITVLDADGNATVTNEAGQYLVRAASGANMGIGTTQTIWKLAKDDNGYYTLTNAGDDTRSLAYNGTGFKAYSNFSSKYPQLLLIPVAETVEHDWNNGEVETPVSCTTDGKTIYTCTVCGDTKTQITKAAGHAWTNGDCANCDEILYATQINSLEEVVSGEYMVVVKYSDNKYYALSNTHDSGVVSAKTVIVDDGKIQVNDSCNWIVNVGEAGADSLPVTLTHNKEFLAIYSGSNMNIRERSYDWTMSYIDGTFRLKGGDRFLAYQGSGFKAYAAGNESRYITLLLFKIPS